MDWVVVLAAGRGVRAGGPKALHVVGGRAWWRVQEERLARVGLPVMWVVSERVLAGMDAGGERPRGWVVADEMGAMFSSVVAGMVGVGEATRGDEPSLPHCVHVLPVDVPAAGAGVFQSLSRGVDATPDAVAAVPVCGGVRGHPVCLRWSFVEARIMTAGMEARLDRLIEGRVVEVEVGDASVVVNLNTAEEFARWERGRLGETSV